MKNLINNLRFNFLYIDVYSFGSSWSYPENFVPYNMLRYIRNGEAVFTIDGSELHVKKDQIIYIPRGCNLSCHALTEQVSFISIRFTTSVFFKGVDFLADYFHVPPITEDRGERKYFEEIFSWVNSKSPSRMFFIRGNLELLIGSLADRTKSRENDLDETEAESMDIEKARQKIRKSTALIDPRIQGVVDYMTWHPEEGYTIDKMSYIAELSKSRFRQLFKEQMGKTPTEYLRELRLTGAARRLLCSNDPINMVGYAAGYNDPNYFIREFKSVFGVTPGKYRELAKE